jgi:hypothetical protein
LLSSSFSSAENLLKVCLVESSKRESKTIPAHHELLKDARSVVALLAVVGFAVGLLQAVRVVQLAGLMDWLTVSSFSATGAHPLDAKEAQLGALHLNPQFSTRYRLTSSGTAFVRHLTSRCLVNTPFALRPLQRDRHRRNRGESKAPDRSTRLHRQEQGVFRLAPRSSTTFAILSNN